MWLRAANEHLAWTMGGFLFLARRWIDAYALEMIQFKPKDILEMSNDYNFEDR